MTAAIDLDDRDRAILAGEEGEAARFALRTILRVAEAVRAPRLIDVTSAHIDGCLYHGLASLHLAERLVQLGAHTAVPATLNVGLVDLLRPEPFRGNPEEIENGRRLMACYVSMGCQPTWTCAPYQLPRRPAFGEQIAWAESNAIVFANSVLGARTDRYGDFIDIFAALTGRVPDAGLHRTENRRGQVLLRLRGVPDRLLDEDVLYSLLGLIAGEEAGTGVPVIDGIPAGVSEDRLKAIGAAAASSGAVALFHLVGSTPEAPTLEDALHGTPPERSVDITTARIAAARDRLSTTSDDRIAAVCLGTPHFSITEFERLVPMLERATGPARIPVFVSTARHIAAQLATRGWDLALRNFGARIIVDTCTYLSPVFDLPHGTVMTNSAKWAFYAPANLGITVAFGSLEECIASAAAGRIRRDTELWPVE